MNAPTQRDLPRVRPPADPSTYAPTVVPSPPSRKQSGVGRTVLLGTVGAMMLLLLWVLFRSPPKGDAEVVEGAASALTGTVEAPTAPPTAPRPEATQAEPRPKASAPTAPTAQTAAPPKSTARPKATQEPTATPAPPATPPTLVPSTTPSSAPTKKEHPELVQ